MKKDKLILIIEKLFPELNILESDNFQIFQNKLQSYLVNYKNDKIEYLLEKYSKLEQVGKEIAEKGFTTMFDFRQIGFNIDKTKFYSDLNLQIIKVHQYLASIYKLHNESKEEYLKKYFEDNNSDIEVRDSIKMNLTQAEILGFFKTFFGLYKSNEPMNEEHLFRFCANNFSSVKSTKKNQTKDSYKTSFYRDTYRKKINSELEIYSDQKEKIHKILNAMIAELS